MFQVAKELEPLVFRISPSQPLFHCSYEFFIPSEPNFPENFIPDPEKIVLPTTNGRKAQDSFPISWRLKGLKFSGTVRKIPSFKPDLELLFSTSLSCLLTFIDPLSNTSNTMANMSTDIWSMSGIRWAAILMPTVPKDHLKRRPRRRPSAAFRLEGQLDTLSDAFFGLLKRRKWWYIMYLCHI